MSQVFLESEASLSARGKTRARNVTGKFKNIKDKEKNLKSFQREKPDTFEEIKILLFIKGRNLK